MIYQLIDTATTTVKEQAIPAAPVLDIVIRWSAVGGTVFFVIRGVILDAIAFLKDVIVIIRRGMKDIRNE